MTGWRLWAVRVSHAGVASYMLWRWASTGNGDYGIAAGGFALALAITCLPQWRRP
jgi:hypothetical protein